MIVIGDTILSDDIIENFFVCNIEKCKGACCVEGDLGAPLEEAEKDKMNEVYEKVKPYMCKEGIEEVEKQGVYVLDEEGDYSTPTINHKECAYAVYDDKGFLKCSIEQAHLDGKIDFKKPISCHLYPIRVTKYDKYDALNYDRWEICSDACSFGQELGVPVYVFLKDALIRKYGEQWYSDLESEIKLREDNNIGGKK
ncbi:DUF3109 family protein [Chondrinema litorale]|uniref:DUF3109 family protein n=1 Tax=Chondrinema litorale TaxID=2994555 RepID=UPI0025427C40|nr:DUF3109 family protein [Chondrinema litorale]UZR94216.1 DUF3109 family protein [Chondrinema litorale]